MVPSVVFVAVFTLPIALAFGLLPWIPRLMRGPAAERPSASEMKGSGEPRGCSTPKKGLA